MGRPPVEVAKAAGVVSGHDRSAVRKSALESPMRQEIVIGCLTRHADGGFAGILSTLTINAQIELRPLREREDGDFAVYAGGRFRLGSGRWSPASRRGPPEITMTLVAPELSSPLHVVARSDTAFPEDERWVIRWVRGPSAAKFAEADGRNFGRRPSRTDWCARRRAS